MGAQPPDPRPDGARRSVAGFPHEVSRYIATGQVGPMARTEYIRDEYWDGGPALDVYVVEDSDDSTDVEPETVDLLLG